MNQNYTYRNSLVFSVTILMLMWFSQMDAKQDGKLTLLKDSKETMSKIEKLNQSLTVVEEKTIEVEKTKSIEIKKMNQMREKRDQAMERFTRSNNRSKIKQIKKTRQIVESQNRIKSRRDRKLPPFNSFFNTHRENSQKQIPFRSNSTPIFQGSNSTIDVQINGVDSDSITQGEDFTLTVHFSTGAVEADVEFWIDMNGNGTWEEAIDFDVDEDEHIMDNDEDDENPAAGIYQVTFQGEEDEGPNRIGNLGILLVGKDTGGSDAGFLYVKPLTTSYSIAGTITPAMTNVLVGAFPWREWDEDEGNPWMAVTSTSGAYQILVPDSGRYIIFTEDFMEVTGGMFPDTVYFDIYVDGHETGYNFNYHAPTAWIKGTVKDEAGNPLSNREIWTERDWGSGTWTDTDATGSYVVGVLPGEWWVGVDEEDLIPDYLVPYDQNVHVSLGDTAELNFIAHSTNSTISGNVFLNAIPIGGIGIGADSHLGWTETFSNPDGFYTLSVTDAADEYGGYNLWVFDLPPNALVDEYYGGIVSGSVGMDFHLHSVLGAIEGIVYDSQTNEPVEFGWVNAWDGMMGFGTGIHHDGTYYLPLPNGNYEVDAGGDGYYPRNVGKVNIHDNVIVLDIFLDPVSFDGSLSGYVYESGTTTPIEGAMVDIGGEFFWDHTETNDLGYYHFDLPNGFFGASAWKEGYTSDHVDNIEIDNTNVTHNFGIAPVVINAVIDGFVHDAETNDPIIGAQVHAGGHFFWTDAATNHEGYFVMDVPSDSFWVDVFADGYHPEFGFEVWVTPTDTFHMDIGLWPMRVKPPVIHRIVDVPHDQGRQVHITWWSGEPEHFGAWTMFSIWRLSKPGDHEVWDYVTTVPFHGMEDYGYVASTLVDSNRVTGPTGEFWSRFRVTAHTFDPWQFFDSEPRKGYSVDNLAPHVPAGVIATGGDQPILLMWQTNREKDMDYYTIYRGTNPGFVPREPYTYTVDTTFVDMATEPGVTFYYIVTATDFNGNESGYSIEVNTSTNALSAQNESLQIPTRFVLKQNYPNPFNPVTTIQYGLPKRSDVTLYIYDALGRRVRTLVSESQEIGHYAIVWDATDDRGMVLASGVYFIQLIAQSLNPRVEYNSTDSNDFIQTRKTILLR